MGQNSQYWSSHGQPQPQDQPAASGKPGRRHLFAKGLTAVRKGMGKVTEGERYQGRENREGTDSLSEPAILTETR